MKVQEIRDMSLEDIEAELDGTRAVSYTHLRAHET